MIRQNSVRSAAPSWPDLENRIYQLIDQRMECPMLKCVIYDLYNEFGLNKKFGIEEKVVSMLVVFLMDRIFDE